MTWQDRGELRADPGIAPGSRNIDPPRRRSIWPSIAVAAAAVAFGGVIWFAYQSGKTSNGGVPPLVKADTSPIKVKPDNPGGAEIPFQVQAGGDERLGDEPAAKIAEAPAGIGLAHEGPVVRAHSSSAQS